MKGGFIMKLITQKEYMEIAELTKEEFDLLSEYHFIRPYQFHSDGKDLYYIDANAREMKEMKEDYLNEAASLKEEQIKEEQDMTGVSFDGDEQGINLYREQKSNLYEEYKDRDYGDVPIKQKISNSEDKDAEEFIAQEEDVIKNKTKSKKKKKNFSGSRRRKDVYLSKTVNREHASDPHEHGQRERPPVRTESPGHGSISSEADNPYKKENIGRSYHISHNGHVEESLDPNRGTKIVSAGIPISEPENKNPDHSHDHSNAAYTGYRDGYYAPVENLSDSRKGTSYTRSDQAYQEKKQEEQFRRDEVQKHYDKEKMTEDRMTKIVDNMTKNAPVINQGSGLELDGHVIKSADYSGGSPYQTGDISSSDGKSSSPEPSSFTEQQTLRASHSKIIHTKAPYQIPADTTSRLHKQYKQRGERNGKRSDSYVKADDHLIYKKSHLNSKMDFYRTVSDFIIMGSGITYTDAGEFAYRAMRTYGGNVLTGKMSAWATNAKYNTLVSNIGKKYPGDTILSAFEKSKITISKSDRTSFINGITTSNIHKFVILTNRHFQGKYGVNLSRMSKKELDSFLKKLEAANADDLMLAQMGSGFSKKIIELEKEKSHLIKKNRQKLYRFASMSIGTTDTYVGLQMYGSLFSSAKRSMAFSKRAAGMAGKGTKKVGIKVGKKLYHASGNIPKAGTAIQKGMKTTYETASKANRKVNKVIEKHHDRKADRKAFINRHTERIKQAPRRLAGRGFKKVFGKGFSETAAGKIYSKFRGGISLVKDRIGSIFYNIKRSITSLMKWALIAFGAFLLFVIVLSAALTLTADVMMAIQAFSETITGETVNDDNPEDSVAAKLMKSLYEKESNWLDNDVLGHDTDKSPSEVSGYKVTGGDDPSSGKASEIKEFGSPDQDGDGIETHFYNGDAYDSFIDSRPHEDEDSTTKDDSKKDEPTNEDESAKKDSKVENSGAKTGNLATVYAAGPLSLKGAKATEPKTLNGKEVVMADAANNDDGITKKDCGNNFNGKPFRTTGYNTGSKTSSGAKPTPGVTIAMGNGQLLNKKYGRNPTRQAALNGKNGDIYMINGHYYILQDLCGTDAIDIFCKTTAETYAITKKNVKVSKVVDKVGSAKKVEYNGKQYLAILAGDKYILFDGSTEYIQNDNGTGIGLGDSGFQSNVQAIIAMGATFMENGGYMTSTNFEDYCNDLFDASHVVDTSVSGVFSCDDKDCKKLENYKCTDESLEKLKDAEGTVGGYEFTKSDDKGKIKIKEDADGNKGCTKYYCTDDKNDWNGKTYDAVHKTSALGCEGTKNSDSKVVNYTYEQIEDWKEKNNGWVKKLDDSGSGHEKTTNRQETLEVTAGNISYAKANPGATVPCTIVTSSATVKCHGHYGCPREHTKSYCPGHVNLIVNACIIGIEDGASVTLFDIDPGLAKEKQEKYAKADPEFNKQKWDESNIEQVKLFLECDWEEMYGIHISEMASTYGGVENSNPIANYDGDDDIVKFAVKYVGNKYVYGGNSLTNGIDCSHFVYQVLKRTGHYNGGYVTSTNWRKKGTAVSGGLKNAKAGDVLVYNGHVVIYMGGGKIVHASNSKPYPKGGIKISKPSNLNTYHGGLVAIRRFK